MSLGSRTNSVNKVYNITNEHVFIFHIFGKLIALIAKGALPVI